MATAFAGPLSRFYGGEPAAAHRLRPGVEAWRADLHAAVNDKVRGQLQWDETAGAAMTTDLDVAGWMALRLFAFYAERTDIDWPDTTPPLLELDAEWRAAVEAKFAKSRYGQLLPCTVWLPGDFPLTLRAPMPDGATAEIGSLGVLVDQLRWLNQRTFDADAAAIASWRELPAPPAGPLLDGARRGYAALWAAAEFALRQQVPLVVRET